MGRRSRGQRRGRQQQQIDGFRPGKEPPALKKRRAREQLGSDASWAQKQMVDAMAGQSPEQLQKTLQRWSLGLLIGAIVCAIGGILAYTWILWVGLLVHLLGAGLVFLWFRLRNQQKQLMEMARMFK